MVRWNEPDLPGFVIKPEMLKQGDPRYPRLHEHYLRVRAWEDSLKGVKRKPGESSPAWELAQIETQKLYTKIALAEKAVAEFRAGLGATYRIEATVADGNCLFRALSRDMYGHESQHATLRTLAVGHMRAHPGVFAGIDPAITPQYLATMIVPATDAADRARWGGFPEIYALARELRRRIFVHAPDFGGGRLEVKEELVDAYKPLANQADFHVYWTGRNHYEALRPKTSPVRPM